MFSRSGTGGITTTVPTLAADIDEVKRPIVDDPLTGLPGRYGLLEHKYESRLLGCRA